MPSPNFSLPYPPVLNNNDNLQYIKALVPVGFATTVAVFTTSQVSQTQGRFFVTGIVIHDPTVAAGAVGSVTLAFGSASTSTTSISPVLPLTGLGATSGSPANLFQAYTPGIFSQNTANATTTAQYSGVQQPCVALGPNDVLVCNVTAAAGTTSASVLVDILGYYI